MSIALNVICIDDNVEMVEYLRDVVHEAGHVAYVAQSGTDGLRLIEKIKPELVLLDLDLPDIQGQEVCERVKKIFPQTKIIMITNYASSSDVVRGLHLGADDYLGKPIHTQELLARIAVLFRDSRLSERTLRVGDLELDQTTHQVKRGLKEIKLSAQEFKLLQYMMQNEGMVLTRDMILSRIWDGNPDVETRVVDVYVGYIRKKIDFKKPHLIHTQRGFGYSIRK